VVREHCGGEIVVVRHIVVSMKIGMKALSAVYRAWMTVSK
jgi:hypothetical protein